MLENEFGDLKMSTDNEILYIIFFKRRSKGNELSINTFIKSPPIFSGIGYSDWNIIWKQEKVCHDIQTLK